MSVVVAAVAGNALEFKAFKDIARQLFATAAAGQEM